VNDNTTRWRSQLRECLCIVHVLLIFTLYEIRLYDFRKTLQVLSVLAISHVIDDWIHTVLAHDFTHDSIVKCHLGGKHNILMVITPRGRPLVPENL
jgi:hypothetical protein